MFTKVFRMSEDFAVPSVELIHAVESGADVSGIVPASLRDTAEKEIVIEYARETVNARGETVTATDGASVTIGGRSDASFLYEDFKQMERFYDDLTARVMRDAIKYAENSPNARAVKYRITVKYREILHRAKIRENGKTGAEYRVTATGYASAQFDAIPRNLEYAYVSLLGYDGENVEIPVLFKVPSPKTRAHLFHLSAAEGKRRNESANLSALLRSIMDAVRADKDRADEGREYFGIVYDYNAANDTAFTPCKVTNDA